jgi:septum formation inhibitor MinC
MMSELSNSMDDTMREVLDTMDDTEEVSEDQATVDKHPRGEDGKFVEKEEKGNGPKIGGSAENEDTDSPEEPEVSQAASDSEVVEGTGGLEPERETETPAELINPPSTWTAQAKAQWKELPGWAKAEVHKREMDGVRGYQQLAEKASFADRMNEIISPYKATITAEGATPEQTVQGMLNTAYQLRQPDPYAKVQLAVDMATKYGFINELVAFLNQNQQNPNQAAFDPQYNALQQEIASLKETLESQQQQSQVSEQNEATSLIQAFVTATTEDGSLRYPYYENVREMMGILLESGQKQTLEEAYDAALWMSDDTRTLLQSQQQSDSGRKRQEEAAERAVKAKKAKTVDIKPTGTHEAETPSKPTGSVEDTMREVMDNIGSR